MRSWLWLLLLPTLLFACSAPGEAGGSADGPGAAGSGSGGGSSVGASGGSAGSTLSPLGRERCRAPAGVSSAPRSIQEVLLLLNALPKPTSVACFVESLARPLGVSATSSHTSAQPALSFESPRVFIKLDGMWLSVVIDGESSYLIELGEFLPDTTTHSIKGELLLPISSPLAPSAPFDRVQFNQGTVCGACHLEETRVDSITFAAAFSSVTFRPRPDTRVGVADLRAQYQACNWQLEPHRCEMLSAVFGGGTVEEAPFPTSMNTFF